MTKSNTKSDKITASVETTVTATVDITFIMKGKEEFTKEEAKYYIEALLKEVDDVKVRDLKTFVRKEK